MTNIEHAARYAAKCRPAVSGSGGHDQTYSVAYQLCHGFDLTEDETFTVLRDVYNPTLREPWSPAELRHKAKDAFNAVSKKPRGWLLASRESVARIFPPSAQCREPKRGTLADVEELARLRGIPWCDVHAAWLLGSVRFGMNRGQRAWCVTDRSRKLIEWRRLDGLSWFHGGKSDSVKTVEGGGNHLLGLPDLLGDCPNVLLVEGAPNLVAGFTLLREFDLLHDYGLVAMSGAGKWMLPEEIQQFRGRRILIAADNDEAGRLGVDKWHAQLDEAKIGCSSIDWDGMGAVEGDDVNSFVARILVGKEVAA
jgi:hypothetical protein